MSARVLRRRPVLAGVFRDRRRRQQRPHALRGRSGRASPSRLDHQGDDALPAVRATRQGRADACSRASRSPSTPRRRSRRSSASSRARRSASRTRSRRSSPARPTTSRSRSPRRSATTKSTFAEMMTRKAHALGMANTTYRNASGLPNDQQITTARDLTILGALARGPLSALLPIFLHRRVRIRRRDDRQSQPSARAGRRRRRHQDRLHPRLRLQPPDLGPPRRPIARRRRHGRPQRARPRSDHGEPDRGPSRAGLDGPHRDRGRRRLVVRATRPPSRAAPAVRAWPSSPRTCRRAYRPPRGAGG